MPHPVQPVELDKDGVARFKANKIIEYLWETGHIDLNLISLMHLKGKFSQDDMQQLAQLMGYSVSGYADLSYADGGIVDYADNKAKDL